MRDEGASVGRDSIQHTPRKLSSSSNSDSDDVQQNESPSSFMFQGSNEPLSPSFTFTMKERNRAKFTGYVQSVDLDSSAVSKP